jgi:hypothetical protein
MRPLFSTPTAAALSLALASCGARSALQASGPSGGTPDAGSGPGPDAGKPTAPVCHAWTATGKPVQVSNIPSIAVALSASPVPGGVLVGFGDAQFPPVDPTWHLRTVAYGDASLGPDQTVLMRNTSQLGWSGIYAATNGGAMLATASDEGDGMYTVPIDATGAPTGAPVTTTPGDQGQFLAAAGGGFSVLRSPWDDTGEIPPPVSLATLSAAGDVLGETTILPANASITDFGRVVRDDQSFLLWWYEATGAGGSFMGRPFDALGDAQGSAVLLRALGPMDYGGLALAASTSTTLGVWPVSTTSATTLMAQPYDASGAGIGGPVAWGMDDVQGLPTMAAAGAPGGDYVVAWIYQSETSTGQLQVQAVASDGTAEGPPTLLGDIAGSPETDLFVVATTEGAMVFYESDTTEYVEVFAIPLACAE